MLKILKNFVMMISLSLITLFLVWFGLRNYGLSQSYSANEHPLNQLKKPLVFAIGGWGETIEDRYKVSSFQALRHKSEHLISASYIYRSKDDLWFLSDPESVKKVNDIRSLDSSDWAKKLASKEIRGIALETLRLSEFPGPIALMVDNYEVGDAESLNNWITKHKWQDKVFIYSKHDGFLRDLRKINPTLLFSVGQAKLTQFLLLDSYGLESLGRLKNDFVIFDSRFAEKISVKPSTIIEIHRQKKLIFIEDVNKPEVAKQLVERGIDGFTTTSPTQIMTIFE